MSRQLLDRLLRLRIVGIITKDVHGRDILERLIKTQTMDTQAFEWQMQLRFYWERYEQADECIIRQTITKFRYNYVCDSSMITRVNVRLIASVGIFGLHEPVGDITFDRAMLHDADDGPAFVPRW